MSFTNLVLEKYAKDDTKDKSSDSGAKDDNNKNSWSDSHKATLYGGGLGALIGGIGGFATAKSDPKATPGEKLKKRLKMALLGSAIGGGSGLGLGYAADEFGITDALVNNKNDDDTEDDRSWLKKGWDTVNDTLLSPFTFLGAGLGVKGVAKKGLVGLNDEALAKLDKTISARQLALQALNDEMALNPSDPSIKSKQLAATEAVNKAFKNQRQFEISKGSTGLKQFLHRTKLVGRRIAGPTAIGAAIDLGLRAFTD